MAIYQPLDSASVRADGTGWWVICLCAAWCDTCGEYRRIFDALAWQWPNLRFEWVDIEDDAALVGDLDIQTFPTLLIVGEDRPLFMGPLLPQAGVLNRLIASLRAGQLEPISESCAGDVFRRIREARN